MKKLFRKYYFVLIPVVVTALCAAFGLIRYIINDDTAMLKIAESFQTNSHSEHLVFISVILGYLLKLLYNLVPDFNWFITMYLLVVNCGFIALCGIVKKLGERIIGYAVIAAFQVFVLSNLTFTSISFVCAVAGMLWMFVFIKKLEKKSIKHFVIGFILLFLAFAMRRGDTFYFTVMLFVPVYLFSFIKKRNTVAVIAIAIVLCTVANYAVTGVQKVYNANIPSEIYFSEFRKYRGAANDGGLFNYERHGEELQKAGITENDYFLLKRWVFGDKKVYPAEVMKAVAESRDFDEKYDTNLIGIAKDILKQETVLLLLFALLLMTAINIIIDNDSHLEPLFVLAFTLAGFGFLYFRRRGIERVSSMVLFSGILIMLSIFLKNYENFRNIKLLNKFSDKTFNGIVVIVCILGILGTTGYCVRENRRFDRKAEKFHEVIEYTNDNQDEFFICDVRASSDYAVKYNNDNIFRPYANKDIKVYAFLGTWTIYTYYYYDNLKNLGIEEYSDNLISLLLKDDVRYISRNMSPKKFVRFFKENYKLDVKYKIVKTLPEGNYKVYKFSVAE